MKKILPFMATVLLLTSAIAAQGATRPSNGHPLGAPGKIQAHRAPLADRMPVIDPTKSLPQRERASYRSSGDKAHTEPFADIELSDQLKGAGKISRPVHLLAPELMQQVQDLTDPHYLRTHLAASKATGAATPRQRDKSLPWTADQKLANPTNMNDEYISIAEYAGTGNLYAVFAAKDLGGTDRDIHIAQSTDGGASWEVWEMPAFSEDEYHPAIAIDGAGYIHVTWIRADGYILRARTTNPDAPTQWA